MHYGMVSLILEIEKTKRKQSDCHRYMRALSDLAHSKIKGHKIIALYRDNKDSCEIPHFGHNCNCKNECNDKPDMVIRYFGVDVIIDNISDSLFGVYQLNKHSQVTVCSVPVSIPDQNRRELRLLEKVG